MEKCTKFVSTMRLLRNNMCWLNATTSYKCLACACENDDAASTCTWDCVRVNACTRRISWGFNLDK